MDAADAPAAPRCRRALCAASRHAGGDRAHRAVVLGRDRRGARGRDRPRRGRSGRLGRRRAGAQGDADQLSSLGRGRRRPAGRDRRRARTGSVLVDQRAPVAAGVARPAGAALSPPSARCATRTGKSSRNQPVRPRCGRCGRPAPAPPTSGAWWGLLEPRGDRPMPGRSGRGRRWRSRRRPIVPSAPGAARPTRSGKLHGPSRAPALNPRTIEATLADIAHEIRTPLTGILALGELLATSELGERERGWATSIKTTAEHLALLTSLIVDAARAQSKGLVLAARTGAAAAGSPKRSPSRSRRAPKPSRSRRRAKSPPTCRTP